MARIADPKAKITLLRAAEEVFAEHGVADSKVEEIARRAGLSKGAFYLHFESKEAALKHVVESFLARCGSCIAPPGDYLDVPDDPDELVEFCLARDARIFDFLWENRAILRILGSCQGEYAYLIETFRSEIDQKEREWIEHFRRLDLVRADVDVDLCVTMVAGAYHELTLKMLRMGERPPLDRWLMFAQETFFRAWGTQELLDAVERRNRRVSTGIRKAQRAVERGKV